ncbi:MAG TPA: hypothetical protein PKE03_06685 [Bacteroidales bacterium]|nr:hypothetical protein [Bacteroidales bacterium]
MKKLITILFFLTWLSTGNQLNAQTVEARAITTSDSLLIGEHLQLQLLLKMPSGFKAQWPVFGDTLNKQIEILSKSEPETLPIDNNRNVLMRQNLTITSFDTGYISIPPIDFQFTPSGDTLRFIASTNPLMLRVFLPDVDTAAPIKPIKGIENQRITLAEVLPWILAIVFIAIALWLGIRYYLRYKNRPVAIAPIEAPAIAPHKHALEQLEQLRHEKLWQNGRVKEYYVRLSDIVRVYIEAQFPVNAVEMTTQEIMHGLRPIGINDEAKFKLQTALELADLVKFARHKPGAVENDMAINQIVDFVVESYAYASMNEDVSNDKEE